MRRVLLSHGLLGVAAAHSGSPLPRPLGGVAERWRLRGVAQGTGTGTGSASLLSWAGAFTPLARLPSLLRLSPARYPGAGLGAGLGRGKGRAGHLPAVQWPLASPPRDRINLLVGFLHVSNRGGRRVCLRG